MDKLWQTLMEPEEHFFLNLNDKVFESGIPAVQQNFEMSSGVPTYQTFVFSIDTEVQISSRVVKDFVFFFGELGGLQNFFAMLLSVLLASYQKANFNVVAVKSSMRADYSENQGPGTALKLKGMHARDRDNDSILKQHNSRCNLFWSYFCSFWRIRAYKRQKLFVRRGMRKIEKALDIVTIVKQYRAVRLILKILLNDSQR